MSYKDKQEIEQEEISGISMIGYLLIIMVIIAFPFSFIFLDSIGTSIAYTCVFALSIAINLTIKYRNPKPPTIPLALKIIYIILVIGGIIGLIAAFVLNYGIALIGIFLLCILGVIGFSGKE